MLPGRKLGVFTGCGLGSLALFLMLGCANTDVSGRQAPPAPPPPPAPAPAAAQATSINIEVDLLSRAQLCSPVAKGRAFLWDGQLNPTLANHTIPPTYANAVGLPDPTMTTQAATNQPVDVIATLKQLSAARQAVTTAASLFENQKLTPAGTHVCAAVITVSVVPDKTSHGLIPASDIPVLPNGCPGQTPSIPPQHPAPSGGWDATNPTICLPINPADAKAQVKALAQAHEIFGLWEREFYEYRVK